MVPRDALSYSGHLKMTRWTQWKYRNFFRKVAPRATLDSVWQLKTTFKDVCTGGNPSGLSWAPEMKLGHFQDVQLSFSTPGNLFPLKFLKVHFAFGSALIRNITRTLKKCFLSEPKTKCILRNFIVNRQSGV